MRTAQEIVQVVATHFGVSIDDIRSSSRLRTIARARSVAAYVLKNQNGCTYGEIARALGLKRGSHAQKLYIREAEHPDSEIAMVMK